jgi:hypothetical protein
MTTTPLPKAKPASLPGHELRGRAEKLGLWGLLAHWNEVEAAPWIETILGFEEEERSKRSLERRLQRAKLGSFKPLADFDWSWPTKIDRELVEDLFRLEFVSEAANVVLVGTNGLGKTMLTQNLAHQAILRGHTARFINASALLNELAAQETGGALSRTLRRYFEPQVLVIDEVGYLGSTAKHADLLFGTRIAEGLRIRMFEGLSGRPQADAGVRVPASQVGMDVRRDARARIVSCGVFPVRSAGLVLDVPLWRRPSSILAGGASVRVATRWSEAWWLLESVSSELLGPQQSGEQGLRSLAWTDRFRRDRRDPHLKDGLGTWAARYVLS